MFGPRAALGLSRPIETHAAQITDRAGEANTWNYLLDRYLEGWAEVNPAKIFAAAAHDYRFNDPFVGVFSRSSIRAYLERLRSRFARSGAIGTADLAVFIRGPMVGSHEGRLTFFREVPRLGLTGFSCITASARGVMVETVTYDLNLASDVLRGCG